MRLDAPITEISGVGKARAEAFARIGITTVRELLYHLPRAYENRGNVRESASVGHGELAAYILTVGSEPRVARLKARMTVTKFRAFDESGSVEIVFFNQPYVSDIFHVGGVFRFWGKMTVSRFSRQLTSPSYEAYSEEKPLRDFVPVYKLTEGLSRKIIAQTAERALSEVATEMLDPLPNEIREREKLCTLRYALENIHLPADGDALATAGRRLIFDEIFNFALAASLSASKRRRGRGIIFADTDTAHFESELPYKLTGAQTRAINDIKNDLSPNDKKDAPPMSRIVVGDVGCGKTVVAAAAMYLAVKNGRQAALMAPTEILARQHYNDLSPLFASLGIETRLLVGSTKAAEKREIKNELAGVGVQPMPVIIGTHALLEDDVAFASLGLVVTDEQHRFGVMQRAALAGKGRDIHMLVMSATPIPRTLSLVMYGDLDVSKIDEMPPGRQKVSTFAVDESYRARLNGFIRKQISEGGQVYIVCPTVEEKDDDEETAEEVSVGEIFSKNIIEENTPPLKAAVDYAAELRRDVFPDIEIGFLHGRMKASEKEATMSRFVAGEIKILVSTTVIEVGVNVPNATLMIVENAERFGLSQLHQLRGRVGRGEKKSYCILVSEAKNGNAAARLDAMHKIYDGYVIAERDLALRGPGDFFAQGDGGQVRQSGGVTFKLASKSDDTALVDAAFGEAKKLITDDPTLSKQEHAALADTIHRAYEINRTVMN